METKIINIAIPEDAQVKGKEKERKVTLFV